MQRNIKILSVLLSLVLIISTFMSLPFTIYALESSGKCGENTTYTFDESTGALTISGTGDMTDYEYTKQCPLSYKSEIKSIIVKEGVTGIGARNFCFCENLESITIPSTVTKIGDYAIGVDHNLSSIIVSKYNKVYDSRDNCNAIIKTADNELIVGCKSTVIPDTVTKIGDSAFTECINLTSINIPDGVTSIGPHAFGFCGSLTGIHIPASVTEIGQGALLCGYFDKGSSVSSITVDKDNPVYDSRNDCNAIIETATNTLLYGCNATVIPFSVKRISRDSFLACSKITDITIPYNVECIEGSAFDYTAFDSATIYNPDCEIYDSQYTFYNTKKIRGYENSTAQQYAKKYSIPFESITCEHSTSVTFDENVINPTCTAGGSYDSVKYCLTCGYELAREHRTVNALGHKSDKGTVTKKPTYTSTGIKTYKCTVCGKVIKTIKLAKLAKKTNPLTAKGKTKKIKYKTIKNKNVVFARKDVISIKNAKGKVTYKKASGSKKIAVAKNGKITVKKGLKNGTYKVAVKITAAGNATYKAKTVKKTFVIKVI
ncbi:MAG: leucine-rich repeat domain-containing protein [Eubacterium sp.]|nr:leucine-rich repeat domain-containing protein [Eubacterium sp.]